MTLTAWLKATHWIWVLVTWILIIIVVPYNLLGHLKFSLLKFVKLLLTSLFFDLLLDGMVPFYLFDQFFIVLFGLFIEDISL